ncbi:hypothetical protein RRG08_000079 [Elysia crispata]|uniref:Uncharacterized protein n=1 Tax=Elysia crispata TaxID=231223 RepID=A0AAE1DS34_9GAST|nr:hypothetical protein RRG08_000079 [Elysia crispata]
MIRAAHSRHPYNTSLYSLPRASIYASLFTNALHQLLSGDILVYRPRFEPVMAALAVISSAGCATLPHRLPECNRECEIITKDAGHGKERQTRPPRGLCVWKQEVPAVETFRRRGDEEGDGLDTD